MLPRRSCPSLAFALLAALLLPGPALASRHVLVVSVDGLRPDVALRADMPVLRALMARGAFTMYAVTTDVAITLPSHASMLTGVTPEKHGIHFNGDPGPTDPTAPAWPTLLDVAHRAGLRTALAAGKSKFSVLATPGTVDFASVPARGSTAPDSAVAMTMVRWIVERRPDVMFLHLPSLDWVGHASGWGSPAQVVAARSPDRALGFVLRALSQTGLADSTLVIVSADHGGAGRTHGGTDARSRLIPWIAAGPGVRPGDDLTREAALTVHTEDTFATACAWLGLVPPKPVDGRAVSEIFETGAPAAR